MDRINTQRSHGSFLDGTFDFGLLRFLRKHLRNWFRFHLNRLHAFLAWFPFLNSPFFRPSTKARAGFCILTEVSFISLATSLRSLATFEISLRSETASFKPMLCRLSSNTWSFHDKNQIKTKTCIFKSNNMSSSIVIKIRRRKKASFYLFQLEQHVVTKLHIVNGNPTATSILSS